MVTNLKRFQVSMLSTANSFACGIQFEVSLKSVDFVKPALCVTNL